MMYLHFSCGVVGSSCGTEGLAQGPRMGQITLTFLMSVWKFGDLPITSSSATIHQMSKALQVVVIDDIILLTFE